MLEPEVLIIEDERNSNSSKYSSEEILNSRSTEMKNKITNVDEFLQQLYNVNTKSITPPANIENSSSDDESDNNSNSEISRIPANQFISKTAQNLCKIIETVASNCNISQSTLIDNNVNDNQKSAIKYFFDYFPEDFFLKISDEMDISTNPSEIQELFGIHILMNILKYPRYDMYWSPLFRIKAITERISKERFDILRSNLIIVKRKPKEISNNFKDNLWRIRPIVNSFTKKCQLLATELNPCIDEQIIPFLLYLNTIKLKNHRKVLRVIFSFVGLAVKNSWLEYKKDCYDKQLKNPKDIMDFLEFNLKIAELLLNTGRNNNINKRQKSFSEEDKNDENSGNLFNQLGLMPVNKKSRLSNSTYIKDVRYDGIDHWPIMDKKPQRCKLENCTKKASVKCYKCNLHLCMSSNRNCFMAFHVKGH